MNTHLAQCAFIVSEVKNYRTLVFVYSCSRTQCYRWLRRLNISYFLTSMLTHLTRAVARAQSPLLWALIRIPASGLYRYSWIPRLTKRRLHIRQRKVRSSQTFMNKRNCIRLGMLHPNWNYVMIIEYACTYGMRKRGSFHTLFPNICTKLRIRLRISL